jgi:hypothetical protein
MKATSNMALSGSGPGAESLRRHLRGGERTSAGYFSNSRILISTVSRPPDVPNEVLVSQIAVDSWHRTWTGGTLTYRAGYCIF